MSAIMGVTADFGQTNRLVQLGGTQVEWLVTWPGEFDSNHFVAASFITDFFLESLTVLSHGYSRDINGVVTLHHVVDAGSSGGVFRIAVVVVPSESLSANLGG